MLRGVLLSLAAALAWLALLAGGSAGAGETDLSFTSAALGGTRLHYEVCLPAGYTTSRLRYPVIYFLHGLPAAPNAYRSVRFVERALARESRPAILVIPQGARTGESDPEYLDHGPRDDWDAAVAVELPHIIDAQFRTIADRSGRALLGVSAGGYGAMHLALDHLDEFAVVESWSGYFHPTDPAGTRPLDLGSAAKNAQANVHRQAAAERTRLRAEPLFIAFYVGRSDARFERENVRLDQELRREHIPHVFRLYPGGHGQQLWQAHAEQWLGLALVHLAAAR